MPYSEILKEENGLRVELYSDEYPDEPYDDGQTPIVRIDRQGYHGAKATHVMVSSRPTDEDERIEEAAAKWASDLDLFERYLRAFRGATEIVRWDSQDYIYITYDTPAWRKWAKIPDSQPTHVEMNEWRAWCEGDCWWFKVERNVHWKATSPASHAAMETDTWELADDDAQNGTYYGYEYAKEEAEEAFTRYQAELAAETGK